MDLIASYSDEHSLQLAEGALRNLGIPYVLRKSDDELSTVEVTVSSEYYERACDVVEKLDEFMNAMAIAKANTKRDPRLCRNCRSADLRLREDFDPEKSKTGIIAIYECNRCGHLNTE